MLKELAAALSLVLALPLAAAAQGVPPQLPSATRVDPAELQPAAGDSYVIGAQDELSISVYGEPELTSNYRVDEAGFLGFGLGIRLQAGGRTIRALEEAIKGELTAYIRSPQVRVSVVTYRSQSVMVSGAVRAPQKVPITGTSTSLLEALATAGSPTADASTEIVVTRRTPSAGEPNAVEEFRVNRRDLETGRIEFMLQDGDFITVPTADRFFIDGQVRNPGTFVLEAGTTVQQAIALAGGLTERGSTRNIKAKRGSGGLMVEMSLERDDEVQPNDIITIGQRIF